MKSFLSNRKSELGNAFNRFKNNDFSGNTGIILKNSSYNFATTLVSKIGSLIFMVILARLLLPELFGLYSLALSTIILFSVFTDLGVGTALTQRLSKEYAKKNGSPEKFYHYLFKIKCIITILTCIGLAFSSYFISVYYYKKPIFLALLAGIVYLAITSFLNFYSNYLISRNNFRRIFFKELIFQSSRLILTILVIYLFLNLNYSLFLLVFFLSLSLAHLYGLLYLLKVRPNYSFKEVSKFEKRTLFLFMVPLSATALSGVIFGYIDIFTLGGFVESEFIGYYQAALALVSSVGALAGFSSVLFPVFSKLKGRELSSLLNKSSFYTVVISSIALIFVYLLSDFIILTVYGSSYLAAIPVLQILSALLILEPLIAIYSFYFISQERPITVAVLLIFSTILNIILNVYFITAALPDQNLAIAKAAIATIIAKTSHLLLLFLVWLFTNNKSHKRNTN